MFCYTVAVVIVGCFFVVVCVCHLTLFPGSKFEISQIESVPKGLSRVRDLLGVLVVRTELAVRPPLVS
jgi:hypothetical protein